MLATVGLVVVAILQSIIFLKQLAIYREQLTLQKIITRANVAPAYRELKDKREGRGGNDGPQAGTVVMLMKNSGSTVAKEVRIRHRSFAGLGGLTSNQLANECSTLGDPSSPFTIFPGSELEEHFTVDQPPRGDAQYLCGQIGYVDEYGATRNSPFCFKVSRQDWDKETGPEPNTDHTICYIGEADSASST